LLNIVQHAEATRVLVDLTLSNSMVHLTIQDNGRGFILPESWAVFANEGRFGLFEAHERALNVAGHFHVQSVAAPNSATGTTLSITVPI
jgi:signal transduction histidine kinase